MGIKNKSKKYQKIGIIFLKKESSKKGFTLIEMIISIAIFALIVVMFSSIFSTFLLNYSKAKENERNIENVQYVMNLMAKVIRTSSVANPESSFSFSEVNTLNVFDYSQNLCIKYRLIDNKMQSVSANSADPSGCNFPAMVGGFTDLTSNIIANAYIDVHPTSGSTLGKVTIAFLIDDSAGTRIQTTVSLRQ